MTSNLTPADIGFVAVTVAYIGLTIFIFFNAMTSAGWTAEKQTRIKRRIVIALLGWFAFLAFWSLSGIMGDFTKFPFNFAPVILIPLVTIIWLTWSANMRDLLRVVPHHKIVALQSFRVFVEILLWMLFINGLLPVQMTFEGVNFDILAGISAPFVAILVAKRIIGGRFLLIWNAGCLLLLINIVTVAILSAPSPIRAFMNEPSNTIVATFPTVLLPGFLVPLAYALHFFSMRKIALEKKSLATS